MIFLVVVIALGISHKQDKRYWVFAASASAFQLFAHILFNGCGSLNRPGFTRHFLAYKFRPTRGCRECEAIYRGISD
jgi:hypothetical protein